MRIAVTGASGLVGGAAVRALRERGDDVLRLVRRSAEADDELAWDPAVGPADPGRLDDRDALVHLAGAGIADRLWTAGRKRLLVESRVTSTARLAERIAARGRPPAFVVASAVGYYGDRGDETLDEEAAPGPGFLADLVRDWERAAEPAREAGARVAWLRFGVVLSAGGGALARMLPAFRLGLGGSLGDGRQYAPWVSHRDAISAALRAIDDASLAGPVNVVAPETVTNRDFTRALADALGRRARLDAPAWLLRLALGGLADEALLASQRVVPRRLESIGFRFADPELGPFLRAALGRPA